jgi:Tfp pilus assembly protein PilV
MFSILGKYAQGQKGLGLVEALVAVAILGTAMVAFIGALSAGSIATSAQSEEVVAQGLAQSQLEYTKNYAYNPAASTYPTVTAPEGYAVSVTVSSVPGTDTDIQKVTVTVSRNSETLLTVADYKVNR